MKKTTLLEFIKKHTSVIEKARWVSDSKKKTLAVNVAADTKNMLVDLTLNNWDGFDDKEDESASIENQLVRLVEYLRCLPVGLLSIDKVEADDVIGHIVNKLDGEVHIMSADQDFMQLVNDKVTVYSPIKKKFYTPK